MINNLYNKNQYPLIAYTITLIHIILNMLLYRYMMKSPTNPLPPPTSLLRALAMDLAMLVLPTPGGPWKHKILPCVELFS